MLFNLFKSKPQIPPQLGDKIILTDLPNPRNHPYIKNIWIGAMGIVSHVYDNGGIDLKFESGSTLVITRKYKYLKISFF